MTGMYAAMDRECLVATDALSLDIVGCQIAPGDSAPGNVELCSPVPVDTPDEVMTCPQQGVRFDC